MIAILIVGYNSKKDLPDCLGSIFSSNFKDFRVFFVDNSHDGSVEYIKKNYPLVSVIDNNKNLGYAGGNNLLMKIAKKEGAESFFLLNADTILDKDCLKNLSDEANSKTVIQPLLLLNKNGKNTDLINTDGNYLNYLGFSYCNNLGKKKTQAAKKPAEIPLASGAAMLIPTQVYSAIGGFDEGYFIYHEDADLSMRARLAGFNIKLISDAQLWHKYSFSKHKSKMYHAEKNRLIFLLKNFSLKYLILIFPAFVLTEILMIFYSLVGGWVKEKFAGYGFVIKTLSTTLSERKKVIKERRIPDRKLKKIIGHSLAFAEFHNPLLTLYNVFLAFWWYLIYFFV